MRQYSPEQAQRKAWLLKEAQTRALNRAEFDNLCWLWDSDDPDSRDYRFYAVPPDQRPKKEEASAAPPRVAPIPPQTPPPPRPQPAAAEPRPQAKGPAPRMITDAQVRANRENAQKSTGPRTPEGKARSSRNAETHGLTSRQIVTFGENPDEWDAFHEGWMAELAPEGLVEQALADLVAGSAWRLRRVGKLERRLTWLDYIDTYSAEIKLDQLSPERQSILSDNISAELVGNGTSILNLDRHEAHIERQFYRALDKLSKLRAKRERDAECGMRNAESRPNAQCRMRNDQGDPREAKAQSDSAKRSQFGAGTPAAQGQDELFRGRAAEEAANFGSAISREQAGACGGDAEKRDAERPRQGIAPQSATRGKAAGDSAKRSQFGAVQAGGEAESAPELGENGPS